MLRAPLCKSIVGISSKFSYFGGMRAVSSNSTLREVEICGKILSNCVYKREGGGVNLLCIYIYRNIEICLFRCFRDFFLSICLMKTFN